MQSLPHELLHLIAECLMPRYQCRLALASKYYYSYLYNDLLRWHARKYLIPVPKHNIYNAKYRPISVILTPQSRPRVLILDYCDLDIFIVKDITSMCITDTSTLIEGIYEYDYEKNCSEFNMNIKINISMLDKYKQYIHADILAN